ncbi:MAG: hypothetical protein GX279_01145 [Clostridiaceae bacterium]|jgi:hypothetical protein|nr:hypothetical protein [Clostridiaceae bacterium]
MFGKKKAAANRYIIAVKNYNETVENLKNETLTLPYEREIYLKMIESQSSRADSLKEIRKFARANGKSYSEVSHYWEGLIVDGYTLINVEYVEKIPALDHVCNNATIKFVCGA